MADPPSMPGADHVTERDELVADPALTAVGVSGTVRLPVVVNVAEVAVKGPSPFALTAFTLKIYPVDGTRPVIFAVSTFATVFESQTVPVSIM